MCGLPGAGKSTYIKEHFQDKVIISKDAIRCELGIGGSSMTCDKKVAGTFQEEKQISDIVNKKLIDCCKNNLDCVIDDINLTKGYRNQYLNIVKPYNPYIIMIYVSTPSDICAERRKNELPVTLVKSLKFFPPNPEEYNEFITV